MELDEEEGLFSYICRQKSKIMYTYRLSEPCNFPSLDNKGL